MLSLFWRLAPSPLKKTTCAHCLARCLCTSLAVSVSLSLSRRLFNLPRNQSNRSQLAEAPAGWRAAGGAVCSGRVGVCPLLDPADRAAQPHRLKLLPTLVSWHRLSNHTIVRCSLSWSLACCLCVSLAVSVPHAVVLIQLQSSLQPTSALLLCAVRQLQCSPLVC